MPIELHLKPKWPTRRRKYVLQREGGNGWEGWRKPLIIFQIKDGSVSFFRPSLSLALSEMVSPPLARSTPLKSTINPIFLIRVTVSSTSSPKFFAAATPSIIRMSVEVFRAVNSPCVMRSQSSQGTPVDIWAVLSLPPWRRASITRIHPSRPI